MALARAFLKDAPILILDEPTSSLDPEQEALLEDAVRRLMAGRTVLTIAHRLNTVFNADQIVVLESGRAVENGTHAELLRHGGVYARMVSRYGEGAGAGVQFDDERVCATTPATRPLEQAEMAVAFPSSKASRPGFSPLAGVSAWVLVTGSGFGVARFAHHHSQCGFDGDVRLSHLGSGFTTIHCRIAMKYMPCAKTQKIFL